MQWGTLFLLSTIDLVFCFGSEFCGKRMTVKSLEVVRIIQISGAKN